MPGNVILVLSSREKYLKNILITTMKVIFFIIKYSTLNSAKGY